MLPKIIFSASFTEFIKKTAPKNKVAKVLNKLNHAMDLNYNVFQYIITDREINYLTFRNDGTISYLPAGKKHQINDDGTWKRDGRQNGKPAKVIRRLFTERAISIFFKDADFESFANEYKAASNESNVKFELLPSENIADIYGEDVEGSGSLGGSCMNGETSYLDIYTNCSALQILVLRTGSGKLCGRSLVWKVSEEITFMDRIYVTEDWIYQNFLSYAAENKWYRKENYKSYNNKDLWVDPAGCNVTKKVTIYTDTDFSEFPYIDTFTYGGDGFLSNHQTAKCYFTYNNTDGTRDEEGRTWDDIDEEYIDDDDSVYINAGEKSGCRTHVNNAVDVNGSWYWVEDDNIKRVNGDWYHVDDLCYSEREGEYLLIDDCVYSEREDDYILLEDAVEDYEGNWILECDAVKTPDGNIYHKDDIQELV